MRPHIFTSIVTNYLPKARVLAHSIKRFHPDFYFHLVLCDAPPPGFRIEEEPFDSVIEASSLGIPNLDQWLFEHSLVEACTGVKGFALVKILALQDCSEALYFDPDIVVLAPLDELIRELRTASVLLTPHICEPEESHEAISDNELCSLRHGVYNLGFVGVKQSPEGLLFAQWWRDRLSKYCYDDIPNGMFTDQRWVDLAPAFFAHLRILRYPGYNVSTWNLTHRRVEGDLKEGVTVCDQPVVFYHFSGMDSGAQQAMLDKYGAAMPALYALRAWYFAECNRMGQRELGSIPWRYATFENGEPIQKAHRRRYRDSGDLRSAFPNPFQTGDSAHSYYRWFEENDESRVRPAPAAVAQTGRPSSLPSPTNFPLDNYRVFLSVSGEDIAAATAGAAHLLHSAHARKQLYLIGPANLLDALVKDPEIAAHFAAVRLPGSDGHASSFREVLNRFGDCDFLFLTCGVRLPPMGDLRLSWSAHRQHHVATVSPVTYGGGAAPYRIGPFPSGSNPSLESVDGTCYTCSLFEIAAWNSFRPDCVYVRAEAARLAGSAAVTQSDVLGGFLRATIEARYSHVLADHIATEVVPGAVPIPLPGNSAEVPEAARALVAGQSQRIARSFTKGSKPAPVHAAVKPRQLHVMHSWGGGLERWVQEYCRADRSHDNYVLKSIGTWGAFGMSLHLYQHIDDPQPVRTWRLDPPVPSTAIEHDGYRAALFDIIGSLGIELVMVSSLIGHSLDVLGTGLPTFLVCHDFYPFCPALNISFRGVCRSCSEDQLASCTVENPHNRFFLNVPASYGSLLRREFARIVRHQECRMIAPSNSVRAHYSELVPELAERITVVPHGTTAVSSSPLSLRFDREGRLRVLVLGSLAPNKGAALLHQILPELLEFADLFLVGCDSANAAPFEGHAGVTVIRNYAWKELRGILEKIDPHVGILLSVVPETFSFTLQELLDLGIPPLATRIGSFEDRIEDGVSGFLCAPEAPEILERLRSLHRDRTPLATVHARLLKSPRRNVQNMLDDYRALAAVPELSGKAYFAPRARHETDGGLARCQVYWRTGDAAFQEANSSADYFATTSTDLSLRLAIPAAGEAPSQIRLDPSDRAGSMIVHKLAIIGQRGEALWTWHGDAETVASVERGQLEFRPLPDGGSGGLLQFLGDDPHFILPLGPEIRASLRNGGVIELECTWFAPDRGALPLSWGSALIESRKLSGEYRSEAAALQTELLNARDRLEHSQRRVEALETSISWRWSLPLRKFGELAARILRLLRA